MGEGREEKKRKKKHHYLCFFGCVNVFLSLNYLQYLQVLIQNKALWCRLRAAESSAGSGAFPGLSQHKKDLGICFAMGTMPGQTRTGHLPSLQVPGWAGVAEQFQVKGWINDEGVFGCFAWNWVALKDERTTGVKWSKLRKKGHQLMNAKTSFLPTLLTQTEGPMPLRLSAVGGFPPQSRDTHELGQSYLHISWTHLIGRWSLQSGVGEWEEEN